jgi:hypothetical protein
MLESENEQFFSAEFEERIEWDDQSLIATKVTSKFGDHARPRPNGFLHIRNLHEKPHKT